MSLFLPPANVIVLGLLAIAVVRRRPRVGRGLAVLAMVALWLQAAPRVADEIERGLRVAKPLDPAALDRAFAASAANAGNADQTLPQAIVILGGGIETEAAEYGDAQSANLNRYSLERTRYAAFLARHTHLPILVSGGAPSGFPIAEAKLMQNALEQEYGLPVRWVEAQSGNTAQNAAFSAAMLTNSGITRIYLVTHGWHMRRSIEHFRRVGLTVIPAPCGFGRPLDAETASGLWPTLAGLLQTRNAMREWMAMAVGH
ncbi:YdcF family protein [Pandoraea terrae]|uniref:YdcF family protein n=1 Tax=Pandoraea terrae TaxID=1537710 RepID=UPI0012416521|nr:YdcF family protein [Pandoraea terrae]